MSTAKAPAAPSGRICKKIGPFIQLFVFNKKSDHVCQFISDKKLE